MSEHHTQGKDRQPDSFDADLHPGAGTEHETVSAHDVTALRAALPEFDDDELRRISVLRAGDVLQQGSTYIDLRDMERGEWKADQPTEVRPDDLIVAKQDTNYQIWNRLRGVDDPRRTGE